MKNPRSFETIENWRPPALPGVELSYSRGRRDESATHVPVGYEVVIVDTGEASVFTRGAWQRIGPGVFGEQPGLPVVMRGVSSSELVERRLRVDPALMVELAGCEARPFFTSYALGSGTVRRALVRLFYAIVAGASARAQRSALQGVATTLRADAMDARGPVGWDGAVTPDVFGVRARLESEAEEAPSLGELARDAGMSRSRLVRSFHARFGLTPQRYLMHVRVARARALLAAGRTATYAATAMGFSDQSHLNRWFRQVYRQTPGEYARSAVRGATDMACEPCASV